MTTASLSRTSSPQHILNSRQKKSHTPSASLSAPLQQQAYAGVQPPSARMSPASRYLSNLKVLRRRDPSIISIFDQFSHVCVYHHNGQKWEKHGFEGSMFFFERESYPPYGFYILNRVGMEDYVQRLYPEDDISVHGGYLMLRVYPQFTAARLDVIQGVVHDKFSPVYAYTNDVLSSKQKGESQTIGLWTFTTDGREPLMDVMLRLHSYIKKNLPYPDEYQYGPDWPPPPNPHLRAAVNPNADATGSSISTTTTTTTTTAGNNGGDSQQQHHNNDAIMPQTGEPANVGLSELDKLFAKYLPPASLPSPNGAGGGMTSASGPGFGPSVGLGVGGMTSARQYQSTTSSPMSVQSLFTALGGPHLPPTHQPQPLLAQQQLAPSTAHTQAPPPPTTGLSLLDSIFASASATTPPICQSLQQQIQVQEGPITTGLGQVPVSVPLPLQSLNFMSASASAGNYLHPPTFATSAYPQHQHQHIQSQQYQQQQHIIPIHSPTPKSRALPQPQVLSQNVIGSLLGLGLGGNENENDGGSGGEEGEGGLQPSPTHPSSRDGDNELDEGSYHSTSSSDGSGRGGGVFTKGVGVQEKQQQRNMATEQAFRNLGIPVPVPASGVPGDTTPRPGFGYPGGGGGGEQQLSKASISTSTLTATTKTKGNNKPAEAAAPSTAGRPLIPSEPNSELWPYHHPCQQLLEDMDDTGSIGNDESGVGGEGEIVELDWEDMSALSDLKEFERVRKAQASAKGRVRKANAKAEEQNAAAAVGGRATNAVASEGTAAAGGRKRKDKKKSKKEHTLEASAAAAKEREEIEKSWDFPTTANATTARNGNGSLDSGIMNLNGKTVPIPVTFHDDSPPASPSPIPSPEILLSPARMHSGRDSYGHGKQQEEVGGGGGASVDDITSISSPSVNGSTSTNTTTKKRNRRKLHKAKGSTSTSSLAPTVSTLNEGGEQLIEEGKVMNSMLSAIEEHKTRYVFEKDGFVKEVMRLLTENERFVEDLWKGYCEMGA